MVKQFPGVGEYLTIYLFRKWIKCKIVQPCILLWYFNTYKKFVSILAESDFRA